MMNVGENRARNGVTDCPESRNEENFQSIELLDSSRIILLVPVYERSCYSKTTGNEVLLAAVGQNLNTTVKGAVYDDDGLNDLNHVMMYVKKSCTGMSRQFRLMVKESCGNIGLPTVCRQLNSLRKETRKAHGIR
ncbi:hypothetical protein E3N88_29477 [Mikania micrantha]|uniref:Uncharacterized protein n=1 Tax=Mikania micrantha TaxID=192012 RepID=A0A5N6MLT3_9ASTR|nr:hypothetical protein E3N88_29477 [Mikania micrantha]